MKKSNDNFIKSSVFRVNQKYARMQNKTKELFFRCLDEGQDLEYFTKELKKIWGNIDHSFMYDEISEYEAIIHERNIHGREVVRDIPKGEEGSLFALVPISVIIGVEDKFMKIKTREYKASLKSPAYKRDKQEYLKLKVPNYSDDIITYYSKKTGKPIRQVSPAVYNSMVYNTNATRSVWNTTLNDADQLKINWFFIPYHPFSCPDCVRHQNRPLTRSEVLDMVDVAEERVGDILHPNCGCVLTLYDSNTKIPNDNLTDEQKADIYHIRQKTNGLTLRKERVLTDMKIQKELGNMDEYDKLNSQRNKINASIRELQNGLPTASLQKQVVAINR